MNTEERYKLIQKTFRKIPANKISILTGSNGSGKSLIRAQMPFQVARSLKLSKNKENLKRLVASTSQALRTGSNADWGAFSGIMRDCGWIPTSLSTLNHIEGLIDSALKEKHCKYIVIDEPEIGMGLEMQLSIVEFLNEKLKILKKNKIGSLVISHSAIIVERLNEDCFFNLDGFKNKQSWLQRELVPADMKELDKNELFLYIRDQAKNG